MLILSNNIEDVILGFNIAVETMDYFELSNFCRQYEQLRKSNDIYFGIAILKYDDFTIAFSSNYAHIDKNNLWKGLEKYYDYRTK